METRPILRPLNSLRCSLSRTSSRYASTTQRTKKALKIPPHPSFLTPKGYDDHIVFNPPSSVPSVYHTPFKFLPKTDPRRQANLTQLLRSSADPTWSAAAAPTAPEVPKSFVQPGRNVTREQVEEMRRLRDEDPARWSVMKLAEKFECSNYFVMMCCRASSEHRGNERARLEAIKARWGPIRTKAREDRQKRKVLLGRSEI
ncbi:mitochondrial ribosomal protein subunit L20-domain-containing protein [Xylariales sp. AK1849]|nr:mitochondrial ribosomal protein subunit L20-domain-containing protein [Xylariales sp. AK1849]